jgi:hypothetical protein
VRVLVEELVDRREDTVRNDPYVQEAAKIMETARNHLLAAIVEGDIAESRRLMDVFTRAAFLKEETEDRVRVRLGLLTQDEAAHRAAARRMQVPDSVLPPRRRGLPLWRPRYVARGWAGDYRKE